MLKNTAGKGYMGKKDLAGKDFFADPKRFAELLNIILYHGKDIIQADGLDLIHRNYPSLLGKGEMGRDIFIKDVQGNMYYGLELETESDYSMPERVMVYDACEFEQQIKEFTREHEEKKQDREKLNYREKKSRMKETDSLFPVITAVLYLGTGHWEGRQRLSELYGSIKSQNLLDGILPDYGFPLAEADFINADAFKTDLREFFQAMQCRRDKAKLKELLKTERFCQLKEDTAWAIAVHLDRKRLTAKIEKGEAGMCLALDELLEDERKEERITIIRNMLHEGLEYELIRRVTGCSQKELASVVEG